MDEKVREDPEYKLSQLRKLITNYEEKQFVVVRISSIKKILEG